MKNKSSKRSTSQKNPNARRSYQIRNRRSSTPTDTARIISPNRIHFGSGPAYADSSWPCLRPPLPMKSQKALKRELLRCSNQRPSLLGPQTLQPPRLTAQGSQGSRSNAQSSTSSTFDHENFPRRRSISVHSNTFYATIDRIGPWPDVSITRLRSDGNDLMRPLKTFRNTKNPRVFSPKYYAALSDNSSRFKYYPSNKSYIEEYRKQKGYLPTADVNNKQKTAHNSISSSLNNALSDDDQLSASGTFSAVTGDGIVNERFDVLTKDRWRIPNEYGQTQKFIPTPTGAQPLFPPMPQRTNHGRTTRPQITSHHGLNLPALNSTSLNYLNSINSVGRVYGGDGKKHSSRENPSKLYIFDGRSKQKHSVGTQGNVENASGAQDYSGFSASNSEIASAVEPRSIIVYQLPRRHDLFHNHSDLESWS